jgi:hypothetical protein
VLAGSTAAAAAVTLAAMPWARDRRRRSTAPMCLRWASALALGLAVVHQLRLLAAPSSTGHARFAVLALPAALLLTGAVLALGLELGAVRRGRASASPRLSARRAWVVATVALIALFVTQELLESLVLSGHPAGLQGVFAVGGWTAVPLAVAAGGVIALALAGVDRVLGRAAPAAPRRRRAPTAPRQRADAVWRLAGVLARKLASRAPPALTA